MTLPDYPQPHWIRDLAGGQLDTHALTVEAAQTLGRHGLAGTAACSISRRHPLSDAEVLLLQYRDQEVRQSLAVAATVKKINQILTGAGIPYLVLKGPALAIQTTGDWRGRGSCDLDLLVAEDSTDDVHHALIRVGLRRRDTVSSPPGRAYRWAFPEVAYIGLPVTLDLHWGLDNTPQLADLTFQVLWQRSQTVNLDGQCLPTLSFEDAWLFTAIHGCRSFWFRWKWLLDAYRQWQALDAAQRALVQQRAVTSGCSKAHYLTQALVEQCAGQTANSGGCPTWAMQKAAQILTKTAAGRPISQTLRSAIARRTDQMTMAPSPRVALSSASRALGRVILQPSRYQKHFKNWQ